MADEKPPQATETKMLSQEPAASERRTSPAEMRAACVPDGVSAELRGRNDILDAKQEPVGQEEVSTRVASENSVWSGVVPCWLASQGCPMPAPRLRTDLVAQTSWRLETKLAVLPRVHRVRILQQKKRAPRQERAPHDPCAREPPTLTSVCQSARLSRRLRVPLQDSVGDSLSIMHAHRFEFSEHQETGRGERARAGGDVAGVECGSCRCQTRDPFTRGEVGS